MKFRIGIIAAICSTTVFFSCNNNQKEVDRLKETANRDSIALVQQQGKDTIIANYVNTLGEIQANIDSLKSKERLLSVNSSENTPDRRKSILADIKAIDQLLINDNKKIKELEDRVRKLQNKDARLSKTIATLTQEVAAKNDEISGLQMKLSQRGDSLVALTHRYNDTITEITRQRGKYSALTAQFNTVYYAKGTMKELKDKKLITKTGGLLGIGRTSEINPNADNSAFTKADLTKLDSIPLNAKFSKLVTSHPAGSYKITGDKKINSIVITNPTVFWSESKYLVVMVK
jgi:outer membrane murein-binding lipoprotein Lpp